LVKFKAGPFKLSFREPALEAEHANYYKKESDKGDTTGSRQWTDRQPHPNNMNNYDKWANDPEANIAFNVLTDIISGVGYYTEMEEGVNEEHKNKEIIDEYGQTVNLDEDLQEIVMAMLQKGFCPVERLSDYDLKILPPETFYIHQNKKGKVLKYTQEYSANDVVAEWKGKDMEDIILFFHRRTTSWPYGKSLVEPIGTLLDERTQMNEDMPKAIHRWAYPIPFISTRGPKASIQTACEDRDVDEAIYIGNSEPDDWKLETLSIDPQARFIPYIELIYYQICEGLHAPLLLYLKNATEASATVMMESVDRLVNGIQRYVKRRVEKYLFEPQVGDPVPHLIWGQPKTGLADIALADIAAIYPHLAPNQGLDLLKQFGIQLPEPEWPKQPQLPMQPFQKQPQVPVEQVLERLNDLGTSLTVIETNYTEKRLRLTEAMRMADKTITVYMKRAYPNGWRDHRDSKFQEFARKIMGVTEKPKESYTVSVNP